MYMPRILCGSDSGLIPMMYPDYKRVDNEEANARFEKLWGTKLDTVSYTHLTLPTKRIV